mmetsp:Transcript_22318/g.44880  ORF Transcript_22318/g.44880 Transcript_22318/m.44880 type:complete len:289 (-) Transcript_22318:416-1282(-)
MQRSAREGNNDAISLVDRNCSHAIVTDNLHSLAVYNLARSHGGLEDHLGFLAAVDHDTLALASDVDGSTYATQDVDSLLLVLDSNLHNTLLGGLILDVPFATSERAGRGTLHYFLLGCCWLCDRSRSWGSRGITSLVLTAPSLHVLCHLLEARCDRSILVQRSEKISLGSSASGSLRLRSGRSSSRSSSCRGGSGSSTSTTRLGIIIFHVNAVTIPCYSGQVMLFNVRGELCQQNFEGVAEFDLVRVSCLMLLANIIGPVIRTSNGTFDEFPRGRLDTHPIEACNSLR